MHTTAFTAVIALPSRHRAHSLQPAAPRHPLHLRAPLRRRLHVLVPVRPCTTTTVVLTVNTTVTISSSLIAADESDDDSNEDEDIISENNNPLFNMDVNTIAVSNDAFELVRTALHPLGLIPQTLTLSANRILKLSITRENESSASCEDCKEASRIIDDLSELCNLCGLDDDDDYTLEISSLGVQDDLEDWQFEIFRSFPVCVSRTDGKTDVFGTLAKCDEQFVRVSVFGRIVKIDRKVMNGVRLCTAKEVEIARRK